LFRVAGGLSRAQGVPPQAAGENVCACAADEEVVAAVAADVVTAANRTFCSALMPT
jgi:hypothetical protein